MPHEKNKRGLSQLWLGNLQISAGNIAILVNSVNSGHHMVSIEEGGELAENCQFPWRPGSRDNPENGC